MAVSSANFFFSEERPKYTGSTCAEVRQCKDATGAPTQEPQWRATQVALYSDSEQDGSALERPAIVRDLLQ